MIENDSKNMPENPDEIPDQEVYEVLGETDDEIILQINKRKDENRALKKLLENLNTSLPAKKQKKV